MYFKNISLFFKPVQPNHPLITNDENLSWLMNNATPEETVEEKWKLTFSSRICDNICYYFETYKGLRLFAPQLV